MSRPDTATSCTCSAYPVPHHPAHAFLPEGVLR